MRERQGFSRIGSNSSGVRHFCTNMDRFSGEDLGRLIVGQEDWGCMGVEYVRCRGNRGGFKETDIH